MKWKKLGLVFSPANTSEWARHSSLQPTACLMESCIRVYAGFRDAKGVSRVGYVDLDREDPRRVISVATSPALEVGEPGTFDSQGVVPTAIVKRPEGLFLYYAGYQIPNDVRFLVFGGLAVSQDEGRTFTRLQKVPVMERTDEEPLFRVPHSLLHERGVWRCWYGGGGHFIQGEKKTLPVYDIRYVESPDGIHFGTNGRVCLAAASAEHRLGRPFVLQHGGRYKMFYGYGTETTIYRLGYAESADGLVWTRKDAEMGLDVSAEGWDSEMVAYPCVVNVRDRVYLFYNGNGYGRDGFGCAELVEW